MRGQIFGVLVGTGLLAMVGCAASGEVVPLEIRARPAASLAQASASDGLRVAVLPFDDQRQDKRQFGVRSHIFGGETYFNAPGGDPGLLVAQAMAEYLRQSGWQAWLAKPGITVPGDAAEILLTGQVLEFNAQARSRFFSTEVITGVRIAVEAKNVSDGSTARFTMVSSGSEPVFWFDSDDVQSVLNEAIRISVDKMLANTRVENRQLKTP